MIIRAVPAMPLDTIGIDDQGVAAVMGRLSAVTWEEDGQHEHVIVSMHPDETENFIATHFPGQRFAKRRLN